MATGFCSTAPLECVYSWSTWGEGGYICLGMSVSTCGMAVDATVPEVDTSEDAMSPWYLSAASGSVSVLPEEL